MKKLGLLGKFLFFINSVIAITTLMGYLLPFISPSALRGVAILALFLPILIFLNVLFAGYWLLRFRKELLLSVIVLVIGIPYVLSLYQYNTSVAEDEVVDLTVLSYNVRVFGKEGWARNGETGDAVVRFIEDENAAVVCLQEYRGTHVFSKEQYPYQHKVMRSKNNLFGQLILSKYPIVTKGDVQFKGTVNNAIYADIAVDNDTVRVYNTHFQSLGISSHIKELSEQDSDKLSARMSERFKMQEAQLQQVLESEKQSPYPVIIAGDLNNSATSYLYRTLKGEKQDAFAKAGSGIGRTFSLDFVPLRIDFILADEVCQVVGFENYDIPFSDHYPIKASFSLK